ncbi:MAG: thioredoxin fold domain-containing protein [Thioalkalispiraceae bacterium]|jgi:thioredoxin-related protein
MINGLRFILLVLVVSLSTTSYAGEPRDPYKHFFDETWGDMTEELARAKEENKSGVLVFFEMDECPFCHYMKMNVLNQPEVQQYFRKHFINITIDIEGDVEMVNFKGKSLKQKDFAFKENRVRATPVIAFFDLNGKRVHRHIGKTNGVEEFLMMGEYVVEDAYKKMPFIRYKRQQRR